MAFIDKKDPVVINIKLTTKGRELLSQGKLNFSYYTIGDSEVDYKFISNVESNEPVSGWSGSNLMVLRPVDRNPKIISFIRRNASGDPYNPIPSVPISQYTIHNSVEPIGFFSSNGETFLTDTNHVKQPDVMVQVSTVTGGQNLTLKKAPTYGANTNEPRVGDLLFVRWTFNQSTIGYTVNRNYPTPNLFYRIIGVNSGSLSSGEVSVSVDRELPDFSSIGVTSNVHAGAIILYNQLENDDHSIQGMTSTEYLDESVLSFFQNSQPSMANFPFWNLSIVHTEEIAGVLSGHLKYTQFKNRGLGGFVSYIQNQASVYKKLGIIHYTNNSPANVYGEGFLLNNVYLILPTIMWHKSPNKLMGMVLRASEDVKMLTGETKSLDTAYYDLCDIRWNIVGKVFTDLKIIVIEDQELLYAMSYKSNRSWTLPDYNVSK